MRYLLLALALGACTDDSTGITDEEIACPPESTLTYASFGEPLIAASCLEDCHRARSPVLTTQARVQMRADDIVDVTVFRSAMPEGGTLSRPQRVQLGQWLRCGAP